MCHRMMVMVWIEETCGYIFHMEPPQKNLLDPPKPRFDASFTFYAASMDSTGIPEILQEVGFNVRQNDGHFLERSTFKSIGFRTLGQCQGWPFTLGPWTRVHFFGQFWKLGFCSVRECPIFEHRGQLCKFLDHECVARIATWNMPKNICMTYQKPIFAWFPFYASSRDSTCP